MAVKHTYDYETVQAGGEGDASPNNTLLEIANAEDINVNTLIALNPYLLSTGIIKGGPNGTTLILYYDKDNKPVTYKIPANAYSENYTIYKIATEKKLDPIGLINQNKEVLAEYCCFKAGQQVLKKVDEMTNSFSDFAVNTMVVDEEGLTISEFVNKINSSENSKIKFETVTALNTNVGQTDKLPKNSVILFNVYSTGNGTSVKITGFGLQADTTRTLFITWEWDNEETEVDNYRVKWEYQTSDGLWWIGSDGTTADGDTKESLYGADEKAIAVRVAVKPSTGSGLLGSSEYEWSTEKIYYFHENMTILIPEISEVKIEHYKMNIKSYVDTSLLKDDENIEVEFEVIQDDYILFDKSNLITVTNKTGLVSYSLTIEGGHNYHVRARSRRKNTLYSMWTEYKGPYEAAPTIPTDISIEVISETQIEITWKKINSAKNYVVEYVMKDEDKYKDYTDQQYFNTGDVKSVTINSENVTEMENGYISYDISNLLTGNVYLLRMNAVNDTAVSDWSTTHSFILGIKSKAPTTWSSTTTVVVGEVLKLYWTHNSEDSSVEKYARIRFMVNDSPVPDVLVTKSTDKKEKYETSVYELNTNEYAEGSTIEWMVQTAGVLTDDNGDPVYGDWSIKRTVNVYAPSTLVINTTSSDGSIISGETLPLRSYPFDVNLKASSHPNQKPTGYYVTISAVEACTTIDNVGNTVYLSPGAKVYSKYIDTDETSITVTISANDVNLQNNKKYLVSAVVAMSSGLSSETMSREIKVAWNVVESVPYAEIAINKDNLTAQIMPYVDNNNDNVLLSIYRREFDGSFTEIHTNIQNGNNTVVIDPHPSLDYARYRIVARNQITGGVSYNDIPAIPVNEKAIIIQWDEVWQPFNITNDGIADSSASSSYAGSILKLPYNIDVSNSHSQDVSHVRYIGRKRPVSYYGTQLGEAATWNTVIPKHDKETLYALRRLAVWMGNVYVREPSGSGYWASITLSFSQAHLDLTIPVTINITPVEGGK